MVKVITMMTALVPTIGHGALIDFCANVASSIGWNSKAYVIVGTQPSEPVPSDVRHAALGMYSNQNWSDRLVSVIRYHKQMPQSPAEMPEGFWELWRDTVIECVGEVGPDDIFVASELYGMDMARILGCRFLPFNRYRDMLDVKGSTVRSDLLGRFDQILPTFQPFIQNTVTLFGAESCGKTTMSKFLADEMNGLFVPEWAREYLETVGIETTDDRMLDIVLGQHALQRTAKRIKNKPWIFQDTDLLSTLGYYRIFGGAKRRHEDYKLCEELFDSSKSDLYIVMNTNIPFEQDPLRYGGDKRESDMKFWIDLLEEFDCNYYVMKETDMEKQRGEVMYELHRFFHEKTKSIAEFVR